jgi:TonB family protein
MLICGFLFWGVIMFLRVFASRIISLAAAFFAGILSTSVVGLFVEKQAIPATTPVSQSSSRSRPILWPAMPGDLAPGSDETNWRPKGYGLKIISKPKPLYTDEARQNNVSGTVILRVTFLASGQIGGISVVKSLSFGLTEQAIAAVRKMRFDPAKVNGIPQNVTRLVEYTFPIN